MKKQARAAALLGIVLTSCSEEPVVLEIVDALASNSECVFNAENNNQPFGMFDPTYDDARAGDISYGLALLLRNQLQTREEDPVAGSNGHDIRPRVNTATLMGFKACWFLPDATFSAIGSHNQDYAVSCDDMPERSGFLQAATVVNEGEALSVATVRVLTPEHLRSLFGADFDAESIPPIGRRNEDGNDDGDIFDVPADAVPYYYELEDPAAAGRSVAWGTFPASRRAVVVYQLQAVSQLRSGTIIRSNWFTYSIELCMGCVLGICPVLREIDCPPDACGTGDLCNTPDPVLGSYHGLCPNNDYCRLTRSILLDPGIRSIGSSCLPAEFRTAISCSVTFDGDPCEDQ